MDIPRPADNASLGSHESALLVGQKRVLEMVATNAPLADTLAELVRFIEAQEDGLRCGILIVTDDRRHFRRGSGPYLPDAYHRALDGVPITPPYLDPCGQAAHQGTAIIVPDIARDHRWAEAWRDLALSCGLAACRSTPVFGPDGRVLASFAMYYDNPRDPHPAHPHLIEIATHLAGIALERERSQTMLCEKERQARELIAALPAAIYTTDADGRITFYNEAAAELAGRTPKLGSDEWCVTWRLYHPDGRPMPHDQCPMAVALKEDRRDWGREAIAERPDGTRVPFLPYPTPLHDASGALVGAVNMLIDISERKQSERSLAESEGRLRALIAASPLAVLVIDPEATVRLWNAAAEKLLGWTEAEVIGKPVPFIPQGRLPECISCRDTAARGETYTIETQRLRRDGSLVEVGLSAAPLRDACGKITEILVLIEDITERKRAEALVDCQRRALRMLAEGAPLDDVLEFLVRMVERHAPGGLLGSILLLDAAGTHFERGIGPSLPAEFNAAVAGVAVSSAIGVCCHAVARGAPVVASDFNADPLWTRFAEFVAPYGLRAGWSTPIFGSQGKPLGTFANYYRQPCDPRPADLEWVEVITRTAAIAIERARADAALRRSQEGLAARVEERTRELEAAMEEHRKIEAALQQAQRMEALGQLTGGVAHDFNNLLTVVLGQAENIIRAAADNPRIVRMATLTQRAAERGAQLTSQLLAFARNQRLRPESVPVRRLIANVADLARRAVGEAIDVKSGAETGLWPSRIDPAQFESALLNLAINARDAMPEGGRLTIGARNMIVSDAEARRLDLAAGDYVVVSVTDTGCGMSPEVQSRCFEPFFTTKEVGKGTGLGLAQIYGFAKQSGGTATIVSAIGRGATVSLYLPRAAAAATEPEPNAVGTEAVDGQGKTILVVEDQPDVREIIEASLNGRGYRILTAADGVAASRVLESNEPVDLLLTDIVMPNGVSGIELARNARMLRQDMKIVLVSGFARDMQPGLPDQDEFVFLEKPFRQTELATTIASLLGGEKPR